jgi:hypothetical protein
MRETVVAGLGAACGLINQAADQEDDGHKVYSSHNVSILLIEIQILNPAFILYSKPPPEEKKKRMALSQAKSEPPAAAGGCLG